jgi:F-type H+-transporting ATPase subunit gamma
MKTDSPASLRRKIGSAADLQSVVRAMKAQAAASVGQYQRSVEALGDYARSVELGLGVCFRQEAARAASARPGPPAPPARPKAATEIRAIVFGSDQGLVGRFNDLVVDLARSSLEQMPAPAKVWAVGERVRASLLDTDMLLLGVFAVPGSVQAIAALVTDILVTVIKESGDPEQTAAAIELHLYYNRPQSGSTYAPVSQRLLPLDADWQRGLAMQPWPTNMLPETLGKPAMTLRALLREYLFVSLFRACAESLASENASRLAAMDRADRNIDEMLGTLNDSLHRLRQSQIDEELSDVISGFKALSESTAA